MIALAVRSILNPGSVEWSMTRNLAGRLGAASLALVAPFAAMATPDPSVAAFADITTKVTTIGGLAFALAVVGTAIWIGIDLFKKGAKKGAK